MEENKNNDLGELEKLALIADSLQSMFTGKTMVVVESGEKEYKRVINHFREIDRHHERFTIEISGTDFVFILDEDK
jgi:uncharacterized protein YlzI (FlbEa/FlbD family)